MKTTHRGVKGAFWGAALFYVLTAFEFFYMAGPFAAFFYAAYAPALNFFGGIPILAWMNRFFLPHAVRETSSALINAHEIIGAVLAAGGFIAFCVGACQVYYHKLAKKGMVTGGIYNVVRHPQYLSLMICSLGLLILWPRYIVAVVFVTMVFAYIFLAKAEEQECSEKFGQPYKSYIDRTNMFLPFTIRLLKKLRLPKSKGKRALMYIAAYMLSLSAFLLLAKGLQSLSISSLYAVYTDTSVCLSVCELSDPQIGSIMQIVQSDSGVSDLLAGYDEQGPYIHYILPAEWYAAEIPMNGVEVGKGHYSPKDYDKTKYKVIITKASTINNKAVRISDLLTNVAAREPIAEIWVDLSEQQVTRILDMPDELRYEGVPVAVF